MTDHQNPQNPEMMDDTLVSEEIAGFLEGNFFGDSPDAQAAAEPEAVTKADPVPEAEPIPEADLVSDPEADAALLESILNDPEFTTQPGQPKITAEPPKKTVRRVPHATRKRRPKPKKTYNLFGLPQLLATAVWLGLIVVIGVTLGRFLWVCAADVLAFSRADREVSVTITKEDNLDSVIEKLQDKGLIEYPWLFQLYADLSGAEEDIVPGTFTLRTSYDYHALVNEMSSSASNREEIDIQIPEGYNCRQIFQLLEDKGVATVAELEEFAANGDLADDYWFLEDVERGSKYCLEGFLFPDTYKFYTGGGAEHALRKLLNGFKNKFSADLQDQLTTLNGILAEKMRANGSSESEVVENMFTVREVVTVASLIEKEAASPTESPSIASVIYNRLFSWGSNPRYLNIDAALVYALDGKSNLTNEDKLFDSPYNTYMYTGLTPTAIANPGMSSIEAALNPENTDYYYYVLNPASGRHEFSRTYEEHTVLVEKYSEANG